MGGLDIHILRRGKAYARQAGHDRLETGGSATGAGAGAGGGGIGGGGRSRRRDYFLEGEALCREGRLNTTAAMSPGKLVTVSLFKLEGLHGGGGGGGRRGSVTLSGFVGQRQEGQLSQGAGGECLCLCLCLSVCLYLVVCLSVCLAAIVWCNLIVLCLYVVALHSLFVAVQLVVKAPSSASCQLAAHPPLVGLV